MQRKFKGDLFLIAGQNGDTQVHQVDIDLTRISSQDIKLLAINHPEISSFFQESYNNR